MTMYYSTKERENDSGKLPDVSVEFLEGTCGDKAPGFYWCYCFSGCLPESTWYGPFNSEDLAVTDMREQVQ